MIPCCWALDNLDEPSVIWTRSHEIQWIIEIQWTPKRLANYWNRKKKKIYPARGGEKGGNYQFRSGLFWWGRTSPVPPPTVLSSATGTCPATWDVAVFQLLSLSTLQLPLQLPRPKSLQGDMHVDIAVKIMLRAGIKWARSRLSRLRIGPLYLTGQISYGS